ncbi:MAG TPA: transglutaminaseTgpA domain-containing protein [Acidimicrobiia bacterium]
MPPNSTWGWVAAACAAALSAAGGLAATGTGHSPAFGAALGAIAALLAVLALPSLPTRTAASLILALGGVVVVRHVRQPGTGLVLVGVWALATLLALVLIDRADLDERPRLAGGPALPSIAGETVKAMAALTLAVLFVGSLLVPVLGHRPPPRVGGGGVPRFDLSGGSGSSLTQNDSLDTTVRPHLGDDVVMTVAASRPEFWRGETFDLWDGHAWTRSNTSRNPLESTNGIASVTPSDGVPASSGRLLSQTFHIDAPYADVLFAASEPTQVEAGRLPVERPDGTLFTFVPLGQGSSYRVVSRVPDATAATLRASGSQPIPTTIRDTYALQPIATHRVRLLAASVTAGATTNYDKVLALEAWMGAHTQYSLNAPVARQGVDVVDDFLFNVRKGWCEQISSSLVVMLRTLGIPAREATGFVPGERSRLTGEWVVRAKHAHAWAEVYFPGVGWQAFDPTANVPLAGEAKTPESLWGWLAHHALVLAGLMLAVGVLVALGSLTRELLDRRRARRERSWAAMRLDDLEHLGSDAGRRRRPSETAPEYAGALAEVLGDADLCVIGAAIDADAFSPEGIGDDARAATDATWDAVSARARTRSGAAPVR